MTEYVYAAVTQFGEDGDLQVCTCRKIEDAKAAAQILLDRACRDIDEESFPIVWLDNGECWAPDITVRERLNETFDIEWTLMVEHCQVLENLDFLKEIRSVIDEMGRPKDKDAA